MIAHNRINLSLTEQRRVESLRSRCVREVVAKILATTVFIQRIKKIDNGKAARAEKTSQE